MEKDQAIDQELLILQTELTGGCNRLIPQLEQAQSHFFEQAHHSTLAQSQTEKEQVFLEPIQFSGCFVLRVLGG